MQINTEQQCDKKMLIRNESITKGNVYSFLLVKQSGRWHGTHVAMANKRENVCEFKSQTETKFSTKNLRQTSCPVCSCSVRIRVHRCRNCRYSGDWSRIGVISKESEELLKIAAFFVVPFCLFFIVYLSKKDE